MHRIRIIAGAATLLALASFALADSPRLGGADRSAAAGSIEACPPECRPCPGPCPMPCATGQAEPACLVAEEGAAR